MKKLPLLFSSLFLLVSCVTNASSDTSLSSGGANSSSSNTNTNSSDTTSSGGGSQQDGYKTFANHDSLNDSKYASAFKDTYFGKMPSSGNVKALVFLVEFSDAKASTSVVSKANIEKGFFGKDTDTGWESLASFYEKSSYGKLNITGTVVDWYEADNTAAYYSDDDDYATKTRKLVKEVVAAHDSVIDYRDYDSDNDGCLDAIYLVYSKKYDGSTNFWAYQYYYFNDNTMQPDTKYDNKYPYGFVWLSSAFFAGSTTQSGITGIDAETVVHETGHLLGINDYYDYYSNIGPRGGLGGADMMDYNVGDHGPLNKMLLNWIDPIYLDGTKKNVTIDINPASVDNQVIMIQKSHQGSIFGEYLLIDYYRPEGLLTRMNKYFPNAGIRIYHVDSTMKYNSMYGNYDFEFDNSSTDRKFVRYVENGGSFKLESSKSTADSTMLYYQGDNFGVTQWQNFTWNRIANSGYKIQMTVNSISATKATLTFVLP